MVVVVVVVVVVRDAAQGAVTCDEACATVGETCSDDAETCSGGIKIWLTDAANDNSRTSSTTDTKSITCT